MSRGAAPKLGKGVESGAFRMSMAKKKAREAAKIIAERLHSEVSAERAVKREKRLEKQRRKAENSLKSASFTAITDSKKLKAMNKKQLRQLQKTSVDASGRTVLVPAFGSVNPKSRNKQVKRPGRDGRGR